LGLTSCNKIADLTPLADLHRLKVLDLEMRAPPPLAPLAAHPSLRVATITGGSGPQDDIEALLGSPLLEMVSVRRAVWLRTDGGWAAFDMYEPGAHEAQYVRLREARDELMRQ
jgi:hypothetical protein